MAESAAKPVKSAPAVTAVSAAKTGPLTLDRILADLVADKLVAKADSDKLANERRHHRNDQHPLTIVAEQKFKDPRHP